MKRGLFITLAVVGLMLLIAVVPMAAAPGNIDKISPENHTIEVSETQAWVVGPTMCFDWTRFDAEFYPATGLVYILGGRSGANTDGTIYSFDPVTEQCVATGATMPTPISNYTINLVNDGTNDVLCTFGGRNSAGGVTLDVQCYDPIANTASIETSLPAAWTGYTPGAQVVVDNIVYIFGGFNATGPTYMTARTDKYDPVANTFTQLGDLNIARSYIMAASVDGIIYAFGGDTFPSGSLVAQTIAEKMDPAVGTWDDAGVADLPTAGDEGRAFGFDSSSPFPYSNQIVIATLAQWDGVSDEVVLYDVASNTYDTAFANLNFGRRNHAGVFIPLDTADPNDGLPGLWVFGGFLTTDNPPYAPAEFYPLPSPPPECSVLLVDDDWDQYAGEPFNGTGTYYYTSTLEALGYDYTRWNSWTQGDPGLGDLQPYDVVLWFTGYAWSGTITETNQADLATYLNSGGNLLLSSEDYMYDQGINPFGTDYLGIVGATEDVGDIDVVGVAGDPIGDGLGPYNLVVPTSWPPAQPMYTDYIQHGASSNAPFMFLASGENNSTDTNAGIWKTAFTAWPLEGLDVLADREAVFGAALSWMCAPPATGEFYLTPPSQTGTGTAGVDVPYTLTIMNSLGTDETFLLDYDSIWPISGPMSVTVATGDSVDFVATVTIPADGNCYDADSAVITATVESDPVKLKTAAINTSIVPAGLGSMEGFIYDANTEEGIYNAHIALYVGNVFVEAYTNVDGSYTIPNLGACKYDGDANAYGYFDQYGLKIPVTVGEPTSFDVTLDASWPALYRAPVDVTLPADMTGIYDLYLKNNGTGDLNFHITDVPSGTYPLPMYVNQAMPSGVDPQVYADIDASTDGSAKFIVYLRQQADLSAAYGMDWTDRGQYVLDTLQKVAAQTQAGVIGDLSREGISYESRYIVNAIVVDGSRTLVNELAARPEVGFIGPNMAVPAPAPVSITTIPTAPQVVEWNIQRVEANQVWSTYDVTGQGIVISSIDTGVQWDHPALVNQYRGWDGVAANHNHNWWDPYNQNPDEPTDAAGHGTHTMGTMVGSDNPTDPVNAANAIGMAPGGRWLACDGFDNNSGFGYDAELLECAEFLLAPWDLTGANPDPDMRPDIINNSWGGGQAQWWYNQAIYAWRAAGIMGIFSIGNPGSACGLAGSPGDGANMVGVGATDITDTIASFSGRGPAKVTGITKPDVSAPGVNIRSSVPGSIYQGGWNGTSMAAPHVSGEVALIWSAVPELRGDVQITSWIIEQSADGITTTQGCGGDLPDEIPNNVYGWGRINAFDAVMMALGTDWATPWLTINPFQGSVSPGELLNITLSFDTTGLVFGQCYPTDLLFEYNDPYITQEVVPVQLCVGNTTFTFNLPLVTRK